VAVTDPGLCGRCRWSDRIRTRRGTDFWRCVRSETDAKFPKYPRLPVDLCSGFEPLGDPGSGGPGRAGGSGRRGLESGS